MNVEKEYHALVFMETGVHMLTQTGKCHEDIKDSVMRVYLGGEKSLPGGSDLELSS